MSVLVNNPVAVIGGAVGMLVDALILVQNRAACFNHQKPTRVCTALMVVSGRPIIELFDTNAEYKMESEFTMTLNGRHLPLLCSATLFLDSVKRMRELNHVAVGNDLHRAYGTGIRRCLKRNFGIDVSPRLIRHVFAAMCYRKYDFGDARHVLERRGISERVFLEYIFDNKRLTAVPAITFTGDPVEVTPMKLAFV
tara:strand:+ start:435 stop:1022 length:588 start_codon:yes stop_codon:yes gene_type:complete